MGPLELDTAVPISAAPAPWAADPLQSRGRRYPEPVAPTRNDFQRDRDRVVHSTAFRRLIYKTQVFLNHEGDLFRTRLTHSLEVAQLARSIARTLGLHEDLVEAIALAHDLGHTPFGHAGQDTLNACMADLGGFEHNLQSLRVVDELEERYPDFNGLNLSWETREGILKHCSAPHAQRLQAAEPDGPAGRFLSRTAPSLEAQLCNLADEIAYNSHDIDDGVRSGLLKLEQMQGVPLFARWHDRVLSEHPRLEGRRLLFEILRRMLSEQVYDVITETRRAIAKSGIRSRQDVPQAGALVRFSPDMRQSCDGLKRFLMRNLYRHPQVMETTDRAKRVVRELFAAYCVEGAEGLPATGNRALSLERRVADHIAGMTDRYALKAHERLTGERLWP